MRIQFLFFPLLIAFSDFVYGQQISFDRKTYFGISSQARITIIDSTADQDAASSGRLTVRVYSSMTDSAGESIPLQELGSGSGIFIAEIGFERSLNETTFTHPSSGNGKVGVYAEGNQAVGEYIFAEYKTLKDSSLFREPVSTVTGVLKDNMGNPVNGAVIGIIGTSLVAFSRSDGSYGIHDVPRGSYSLKVTRDNYTPLYSQVTVPDASPIAFPGGPYIAAVGTDILLSAGGYDLQDTALTYAWDWNHDGIYADASGQNPSYTVARAGLDTVWLRVQDSRGNADEAFALVYGEELPTSDVEIPREYALSQNFPNPFYPSTTIQYSLPAPSRVNIRVYNLLGQVVAELVNDNQSANYHSLVWNASVSTGIYFCRIEAVDIGNPRHRFADTKKLLVIK